MEGGVIVLFLLSLSATGAHGGAKFGMEREWQLWKTEHGKSYESQREELERHLVWLSNREYINAHNENKAKFGFTLSMNQFGDRVSIASIEVQVMTVCLQLQKDGEFAEQYLSQAAREPESQQAMAGVPLSSLRWSEDDSPQSVDWRQEGIITPVKDQV